ncbi:MAG: hypothetical protein O9324_11935 [Microcystis sp. LE19-84.1B]|uniref:hypothetical protein n=1 Tax=Microcystis sp. LE19-84.1B TaxID=3016438 RepID=UPI0022C6F17C|nr:hypothetical protein [Microcystis sp. LE19-84.1B]MCZ8224630.1 hypothetical protein [Microcystis sp. LE19-84.1B]
MRRTPLSIAPDVGLEARNVKSLSPTRQGADVKPENSCPNGRGQSACAWTGAVLAKPKAATLPAMARAPVVTRLEMFVIILSGLLLFIRAKYGYYAL